MSEEAPPPFPFQDWSCEISPRYRRIRDDPAPARRVVTVTGDRVWLAGRYDVARRVLADPRMSLSAAMAPGAPRQEPILLRTDGARGDVLATLRDRGLTRVMRDALGPRAMRRHRPWAYRTAGALIDGLVRGGPVADLYDGLALPLAFATAGRVLLGEHGEGDRRELDAWCDIVLTFTGHDAGEMNAAVGEIYGFFLRRLPEMVAGQGCHLVRSLARARGPGGRLTEGELAEAASLFLVAGYRTSASFLGNALVTLLRHPGVLAAVGRDPALVPAAVEELLRYTPMSTGGAKRVATRDVELGGMTIGAGECVLVSLESANRDPRAFAAPEAFAPERFLPGRGTPAHLGLGHGRHHCPGNRLARLQLETLLRCLPARLPALRLAVPVEELAWRPGVAFRHPEAIPARW
ncbi:cytochrome P450 [Microtetraspora sp. NBRC 13810]|uniref:cytochrome P450 n=1 Tax=Microtetraspora sp. NBRC 13810 TaxID=3030990 RepID=UPI0024A2AD3A|nr:cytochrome P450 [Microtetraspora sp. NBRC 13810]GLW06868.1 cytochrome P450 [Microtetraspora sp. NBRC 13810]